MSPSMGIKRVPRSPYAPARVGIYKGLCTLGATPIGGHLKPHREHTHTPHTSRPPNRAKKRPQLLNSGAKSSLSVSPDCQFLYVPAGRNGLKCSQVCPIRLLFHLTRRGTMNYSSVAATSSSVATNLPKMWSNASSSVSKRVFSAASCSSAQSSRE